MSRTWFVCFKLLSSSTKARCSVQKGSVLTSFLSASYLANISYNTCLISRLDSMAIDKNEN